VPEPLDGLPAAGASVAGALAVDESCGTSVAGETGIAPPKLQASMDRTNIPPAIKYGVLFLFMFSLFLCLI
jgi:hypothetical protein